MKLLSELLLKLFNEITQFQKYQNLKKIYESPAATSFHKLDQ